MNGFSSLLKSGMQMLHGFTCSPAIYIRPARGEDPEVCLTIQVCWGRTEFEEFSERAVMLRTEAEDALINPCESLLSAIGEPRPGDKIRQDDRLREVLSLGEEPCFRYESAQRTFLRIHTRIVKESACRS